MLAPGPARPVVPASGEGTGDDQAAALGLLLLEEDGGVKMDEPAFGSPFSDTLNSFDFYGDDPVTIASVQAPANQMPKEVIFVPALIFLLLVAMMQRARMSPKGVPA